MNKFNTFYINVSEHYSNKIITNFSPSNGYRCRCEFGYYKNSYIMHKNNKKLYLEAFPNASRPIQELMPNILNKINNDKSLKEKLFQINFRSNTKNELMVTLIYHKNIDNKLIKIIEDISRKLKINILLRSKNFLYSTESNYFVDYIHNDDFRIYQTDNCFFQPNAFMLPKMIDAVISLIHNPVDLLELYCGAGTFTLPLSKLFTKILATESDRNSIKCLNKSIIDNNINNISNSRLSSNEVSDLFKGKTFRRMGDIKLSDYNFSHVLVDPPRSGLDDKTIEIIKSFKNIIYISCNPNTYIENIRSLDTHNIEYIELFDQFPNTDHLEIISLLSAK